MRAALVILLAGCMATSAGALTIIAPEPVPGPRCEAALEHGTLGPVEAVGRGRFIQRAIENRRGRPPIAGFLFVDCNLGETASVAEASTDPGGADPYVVRPTTTVDALMRLSNARGDMNSRSSGPPDPGALTNPYCGCAILYPDSPAAKWGRGG